MDEAELLREIPRHRQGKSKVGVHIRPNIYTYYGG